MDSSKYMKEQLDKILEEYEELKAAVLWNTSCIGCAKYLDMSYESYQSEEVEHWRSRALAAEDKIGRRAYERDVLDM